MARSLPHGPEHFMLSVVRMFVNADHGQPTGGSSALHDMVSEQYFRRRRIERQLRPTMRPKGRWPTTTTFHHWSFGSNCHFGRLDRVICCHYLSLHPICGCTAGTLACDFASVARKLKILFGRRRWEVNMPLWAFEQ